MAKLRICLLLVACIGGAIATSLCPIYGPVFPPVANLSKSPTLHTISTQIGTALDDAFATQNTSHGPVSHKDTYSVQIFSAHETLFEYYHKGSNLYTSAGSHINGSDVVGDSVYRIASMSKLYAVYLLLIVAGDGVFAEPVTKYVPELKGVAHWNETTIGAIAGHTAGVTADLYNVDPIAGGGLGVLYPGVFPPLSQNETSPCIANVTHCTRAAFLEALKTRRFTYLPNSTPAYSNSAFVLIGYIIESITSQPFASALRTSLLDPLGLTHTFASTPKDESVGIIIHNATFSGWDIDISEAAAMGGIFASASDVSTLARSILASTLLPPNTTRAWLKPTAFTYSTTGFVGRPWEIYRAAVTPAQNRVVDIYTKGGNVGVYTSIVALIPDLGVGFTVLVATEKGNHPFTIAGIITDILLPSVEEVARVQTHAAYAGTYASLRMNSSVVISSTRGKPGLSLERWISNGTDMFPIFGSPEDFRLYPSNVGDEERVSWKAVSGLDLGYEDHGAFAACLTWFGVDRPTWGLWGVDDWVFVLGEEGKVISVEIAALKVVLERVEE